MNFVMRRATSKREKTPIEILIWGPMTITFFCAKDLRGRLGQAYLGILVRKGLVALSDTYTVVSHNNKQSKTPMGRLFAWTAFQQSQGIQVFVDGHNLQLINTHLDVNGSIVDRIKCLEIVLESHQDIPS